MKTFLSHLTEAQTHKMQRLINTYAIRVKTGLLRADDAASLLWDSCTILHAFNPKMLKHQEVEKLIKLAVGQMK